MKGNLLIIFNSRHGYTKRYVDIIGNAVGCDAVPLDKFKAYMLGGYDKILFMSSVRGRTVDGFKKLSDYLEGLYKKLIVCGVGMFPYREELPQKLKDATISVTYEKFIPVFYAQGGFDYNELSRTEKLSVNLLVRQLQTAKLLSEDDTYYLNATKAPFDEVKKANVQPLIDYLEGRDVDKTLYCPPEITTEQEEKQFFAELESAAKVPENKKKALKKKLKKSSFSDEPEPQDEPEPAPQEQPAEPEQNGEQAAEQDTAEPDLAEE